MRNREQIATAIRPYALAVGMVAPYIPLATLAATKPRITARAIRRLPAESHVLLAGAAVETVLAGVMARKRDRAVDRNDAKKAASYASVTTSTASNAGRRAKEYTDAVRSQVGEIEREAQRAARRAARTAPTRRTFNQPQVQGGRRDSGPSLPEFLR